METRNIQAELITRNTEGGMEFVISTDSVDRHGTVITGWELANFQRNPVMLYQHSSSADPDDVLGTWDLRVEDGKLIGKPNFESEEINPKAAKIQKKIEAGTLRGVSVGFIPQEFRWGQKSQGEDEDTLYLERNELLEVSIVAIPSNPEALKRSADKIRASFPKEEKEEDWETDYILYQLLSNKNRSK